MPQEYIELRGARELPVVRLVFLVGGEDDVNRAVTVGVVERGSHRLVLRDAQRELEVPLA